MTNGQNSETIQYPKIMLENKTKEMMLNFLKRHYPISRIKHNNRFKRGIIMDGGDVYVFSDKKSFSALQYKLLETLSIVFYCDLQICVNVLKIFLTIK